MYVLELHIERGCTFFPVENGETKWVPMAFVLTLVIWGKVTTHSIFPLERFTKNVLESWSFIKMKAKKDRGFYNRFLSTSMVAWPFVRICCQPNCKSLSISFWWILQGNGPASAKVAMSWQFRRVGRSVSHGPLFLNHPTALSMPTSRTHSYKIQ